MAEGRLQPDQGNVLYTGELKRTDTRWGTFWQGDFDEFRREGQFQIETDFAVTYPFLVGDDIHERLQTGFIHPFNPQQIVHGTAAGGLPCAVLRDATGGCAVFLEAGARLIGLWPDPEGPNLLWTHPELTAAPAKAAQGWAGLTPGGAVSNWPKAVRTRTFSLRFGNTSKPGLHSKALRSPTSRKSTAETTRNASPSPHNSVNQQNHHPFHHRAA